MTQDIASCKKEEVPFGTSPFIVAFEWLGAWRKYSITRGGEEAVNIIMSFSDIEDKHLVKKLKEKLPHWLYQGEEVDDAVNAILPALSKLRKFEPNAPLSPAYRANVQIPSH